MVEQFLSEAKATHLSLKWRKQKKERVDAGGEKRFHFDFAGKFFEESEKEYFESYVKDNKLEEYVTYHGIVGGDEKRKLLKECYISCIAYQIPEWRSAY